MTAQCDSGWNWASNSLNENPCAIAGDLEAPCRGLVSYTLGPLNNSNYVTPQKGSALSCECNTVMYSLFMACTDCQGEQVQSWTFWSQFCDAVYVTQYPLNIPEGTAIPRWAYLNVTTNGTWDPTAAELVGDQPEASGVGPSVVTLSTSTGSSSTGTRIGNVTPINTSGTSGNSSGGGSSDAGAIAGGVVGGLVGLGLLAALAVWFIMKKTRPKTAPSSAFMSDYRISSNYDDQPKYETSPTSARPLSSSQVVYNPSDPFTFPAVPRDSSTGGATGYPQTLYDPPVPRRGQYSGAAEV